MKIQYLRERLQQKESRRYFAPVNCVGKRQGQETQKSDAAAAYDQ